MPIRLNKFFGVPRRFADFLPYIRRLRRLERRRNWSEDERLILDQVQRLTGGSITISAADVPIAQKFKEQVLQANAGIQRLTLTKGTPAFSGDIGKDFAGHKLITYEKGPGSQVRSSAAWDGGRRWR